GGLSRVRPELAMTFAANSGCLTLVSWTYLIYGRHEDIEVDLPGIEELLRNPEPSASDITEIDSVARKLARLLYVLGDAAPWFGRLIAKSEMRLTMAEARGYLHNRRGVGDRIRGMLKEPLRRAWENGERVLLIGHSLGSVIAYDALWELSHENDDSGQVDLFMTLGSPLASRFIKRRLRGANRVGRDRYPTNIRRWENVSARAEMTALHTELEPFFEEMTELKLLEALRDHPDLYNHFRGALGLNVHESYGYLANSAVAECIASWLEAGSSS
ncbi:MAG: hypothetical protein ACJ0SL_03055, partial [Candidatus Rariloculaceae bacterium]